MNAPDLGALIGHAWWSSASSPWSPGTIDGVTDYPTVNATQTGFIGTGLGPAINLGLTGIGLLLWIGVIQQRM